jgi:hypothetical protein
VLEESPSRGTACFFASAATESGRAVLLFMRSDRPVQPLSPRILAIRGEVCHNAAVDAIEHESLINDHCGILVVFLGARDDNAGLQSVFYEELATDLALNNYKTVLGCVAGRVRVSKAIRFATVPMGSVTT